MSRTPEQETNSFITPDAAMASALCSLIAYVHDREKASAVLACDVPSVLQECAGLASLCSLMGSRVGAETGDESGLTPFEADALQGALSLQSSVLLLLGQAVAEISSREEVKHE